MSNMANLGLNSEEEASAVMEALEALPADEMIDFLDKYATAGSMVLTPFQEGNCTVDAGTAILIETCRTLLHAVQAARAWVNSNFPSEEEFDPNEDI